MGQRSKRLGIVVDIAQSNEERAAEKLQQAREFLDREQTRLQEIERYYQDYNSQFASQRSGLRAEQMLTNREFLRQLSLTAEAQKMQIQRATEQVDRAKKEWFACHLKKEKLEAYIEKLKHEESAVQDKLEQKMVDDWVTQSLSRE